VKTHRIKPDGTRTNYKIVSCPELIRNTVQDLISSALDESFVNDSFRLLSGTMDNPKIDIYKKMRNQFIYNIGLVLSWEGYEQIDEDQKPYYRRVKFRGYYLGQSRETTRGRLLPLNSGLSVIVAQFYFSGFSLAPSVTK